MTTRPAAVDDALLDAALAAARRAAEAAEAVVARPYRRGVAVET